MKTCAECGASLWKGNASGHCRKHISAESRAKMADGIRRKIKHDPVFLETLRGLARANSSKPGHMERMVAASVQAQTWREGLANVTPDSHAKSGRTLSARRMAWCPPELRDQYRWLTATKKMKAAEAREIIIAQHEKNMAEFRRKLEAA